MAKSLRAQQGISLLELILVICIVAVLLAAVTFHVKRWMWERDAANIQHSAVLMKQAADLYYFQHCPDMNALPGGVTVMLKYSDILQMLPKHIQGSVQNPWAADANNPFAADVIISADKSVYQLEIKATLKQPASVVQGLATTVGADYFSGQTISWHFLPNHLPHAIDSSLWVLNSTNDFYSQNLLDSFKGDPAVNNYCR